VGKEDERGPGALEGRDSVFEEGRIEQHEIARLIV
jgi:hypothetical protein